MDQHQQRGKIKGEKVVGNDLESSRAVFRVFNILGGNEGGGRKGEEQGGETPSMYVAWICHIFPDP